jgi:hypothetical protein
MHKSHKRKRPRGKRPKRKNTKKRNSKRAHARTRQREEVRPNAQPASNKFDARGKSFQRNWLTFAAKITTTPATPTKRALRTGWMVDAVLQPKKYQIPRHAKEDKTRESSTSTNTRKRTRICRNGRKTTL